MNTKSEPLSKHVQIDLSAARMARLWTTVSQRLTSRTPLFRWRPLFAMIAATGLLLGGVAGYSWVTWWGAASAPRSATVLQTASDRLTVELGRGVTLRLAAHSRVQLLPSNDDRVSIRLQHGSVTCDLDSRASRRFSVLVEDLEVRDTGTRFSVSRDAVSGQVDVTVERGSVEVIGATGPHKPKSISAGERWMRQGHVDHELTGAASAATQEQIGSAPPDAQVVTSDSNAIFDSSTSSGESAVQKPPREPGEPPSAQALFERANVARRAGDPVSASQALQTLLARYPNDTRAGLAALELGRLRMGALSDLPGAVRAFQTALARAPSVGFREDALAHLIEAHAALGDTAQSRALCQKYFGEYASGVHRALVERKCTDR